MLEYGFTQGADFNMVKNDRVQAEGNRKVKRMVDNALPYIWQILFSQREIVAYEVCAMKNDKKTLKTCINASTCIKASDII